MLVARWGLRYIEQVWPNLAPLSFLHRPILLTWQQLGYEEAPDTPCFLGQEGPEGGSLFNLMGASQVAGSGCGPVIAANEAGTC